MTDDGGTFRNRTSSRAVQPGMTCRGLSLGAAALLALVVAVAGPVARAYACSCMELQPGQALENADVAFVGVVAGIEDPTAGNPIVGTADPLIYAFVVEDVMTPGGELAAVVHVSSARDGASCGQTFAIGQRWRLYAYRDGADLSTGICSGNALLAERVPIPTVADPEPGPPPIGVMIALGASALVALVSIWAFTRRGRA